MAKETPRIDTDHQGSLLYLVGDNTTAVAAESFPDDGPREKILGRPVTYDVVYGEEGSWKDLGERAEQLLTALGAFSMRNQRVGFSTASRDGRHDGPIFGRYKAGVPFVQRGAEANTGNYLDVAKENFWHATGYAVMRRKGLMKPELINSRARGMWEKFAGKYGTTISQEEGPNLARPDFQRKLRRLVKMTEAIKLNAAA